ncbi:MAG TPA: TerC family protein [Fimbriimonas sp.]|nr:TerC family protein [Fimbriimonas sp.]
MALNDFSWLSDPKAWIGLVSLTFLQIVLGVDNIVLLTILSGQLPGEQQRKARKWGLIAAMVSRIILLVALLWVARLLNYPFFKIGSVAVSGKSLILFGGGGFLIAKATLEIHAKMEGDEDGPSVKAAPSLTAVLAQIFILDIVFSLDSVITALGMINIMAVQVLAVVCATLLMMVGINSLAEFIDRHPTVKMLALSFLVLIGLNLVAEACGIEIPRDYTYFAMAWSVMVELLNIRFRHLRKKRAAHEPDQALDPGA